MRARLASSGNGVLVPQEQWGLVTNPTVNPGDAGAVCLPSVIQTRRCLWNDLQRHPALAASAGTTHLHVSERLHQGHNLQLALRSQLQDLLDFGGAGDTRQQDAQAVVSTAAPTALEDQLHEDPQASRGQQVVPVTRPSQTLHGDVVWQNCRPDCQASAGPCEVVAWKDLPPSSPQLISAGLCCRPGEPVTRDILTAEAERHRGAGPLSRLLAQVCGHPGPAAGVHGLATGFLFLKFANL